MLSVDCMIKHNAMYAVCVAQHECLAIVFSHDYYRI